MFEYFFLIIWHVGKPKEPTKGTLKILPQNLNPPPGGPLCTGDGEGRTGLMWAIWREQETIVDILLAHRDIDINATTRRGTSPLSLAASRGLTSIVAKLDVRGCWGEPGLVGVNHQGFGRTPLSWATNNGED